MIFRELYPRGLTAVDDLDEATLHAPVLIQSEPIRL
jgi:hypothetical protein